MTWLAARSDQVVHVAKEWRAIDLVLSNRIVQRVKLSDWTTDTMKVVAQHDPDRRRPATHDLVHCHGFEARFGHRPVSVLKDENHG